MSPLQKNPATGALLKVGSALQNECCCDDPPSGDPCCCDYPAALTVTITGLALDLAFLNGAHSVAFIGFQGPPCGPLVASCAWRRALTSPPDDVPSVDLISFENGATFERFWRVIARRESAQCFANFSRDVDDGSGTFDWCDVTPVGSYALNTCNDDNCPDEPTDTCPDSSGATAVVS